MPEFQPGPTMEQIPGNDTPPKRRGRPPGSKNGAGQRGRPRVNLKEQIGGTLVMINLALMALPPTREDALDTKEIELLADAIDHQAKVSPTFRKYLTAALAVTTGGQLISVMGIIAARRLARHEFLLPKDADAMLGQMIGSVKITEMPEASNGTEWVDANAAA